MLLPLRLAFAAVAASLACARPVPPAAVAPRPADPAPALQSGQPAATDAKPQLSATELETSTSDLFGTVARSGVPVSDTTAPGGGDAGSGGAAGEAGPTWDIEVRSYETFDRVRHYVDQFSGRARLRISDRLSEGTRYESMIRDRLRAGGVPEDMYYLALIESGYNPHAYSRAAAVGMWQFMTTTARGMGLRVDWWVDERRDPVRSTEAAVRFLHGLNEQFGSMYLAAAAYNGGPGRVARGLSRHEQDLEGVEGDDMFFALAETKYLRSETREYVPQLIAAALVAKEPGRYGIEIEQRPVFAYDSAVVGPLVPIATIAKAAGTSVREIQELNSNLLRGMTPPRINSTVRVPVGRRARFDSAFATMAPAELKGARVITTKKAASWATLARGEKITPRALASFNPKTQPARRTGLIPAGTAILVPTPAVVAAARNVPDPAIERYGSSSRTHVVRKGENLTVIARRYSTTPAAIMRLNRLKKPLIFPGQELRVRG